MSIDTSFDLQPTTTDPTDDEQNIDATPSTDTSAPKPAPKVEHTDGGLPAIPLLVITSNTAAAGLSAAAIAAGPLAAAGIAAGTLVTAVAMSAASRKKTKTRRAQVKPAPKKTNTPARGNVPAARTGSTGSGASRAGSAGRPGAGKASTGTKSTGSTGKRTGGLGATKKASPTAKGASTAQKPGATGKPGAGKGTPTNKPKGRAGQIKDLRAAKKAEGKSRKQQREQATQTRRALKDGRRGEKAALKNLQKQNRTDAKNNPTAGGGRKAGKAGIGAALKKFASKKAAGARTKARANKDQAVLSRGQRIKQARRNAKSRAAMVRKVVGAKARYGTKAAGAALLTAPAGLLGTLTTPLGRKLGWAWLMHPGRRMFRRLTAKAKKNLHARIADAKNTHAKNTSPATPEADQTLDDTVARAPRGGDSPSLTGEPDMSEEIQSHFLDASADLEAAALAYEPGGMMHVRTTIRSMGPAIEAWANAFGHLSVKADEDFPLGPEIGEGLDRIHQELRKIVDEAESLAEDFDRVHEADINRLINPRKSQEAEKAWDTTANEDFTE
ncbi:hypothetical protein [Streptomyces sp. NPDC056192]|uniref:hypothetical protein n=1 Tax=Streptomyces sp. NPDC056192 TaxID=3345743 RepID=UPI0035DC7DE1